MATVDDLTHQQRTIQQRISQIQRELDEKRQAVALADSKLDEIVRAELRGISTASDVIAASNALDKATGELAAARRLHDVAFKEAARVDLELMRARAEVKQALRDRVCSESVAIEKRLLEQNKVRGELLKIYGLWSAYHGQQADWDIVISEVFAAPTEEEHARAVDYAVKQLGLER